MNRRELIHKTSLVLGYSLSASTIAGLLGGCEIKHVAGFKPAFFSDEQAIAIADMAEVIIPKTATPGAREAGVPAFIDNFISQVYSKEEQTRFLKELDEFIDSTVKKNFAKFTECTPDTQKLIVTNAHTTAVSDASTNSEGWWNNNQAERPFILKVKELTILGFFTSQAGATQVLKYDMAPGPYQGCVPLIDVGKAWAM